MAIKKVCEKIILIIITISILLSFMVTPVANAKLDLEDGDFYYSGTTKGNYVPTQGIFSWIIDNLGMIADWIFGLISMIVRMPIIGWVALIEKLLTWSVEQTAGVSNNGGLVVDSSDVTAIGDSSGNLTVQAIVYNRVPLFDINFFNLEMDKTVSPTGQVLRCEKCKKECKDCCSSITEDNIPAGDEVVCVDCDCNCSNCQQYLANWQAEKPLVIQIREFVAMWYTIIRLLSMVAMLIALLGIGIKMALSTVASEKAVYKRMLVDWVVGMIILFAMHYLIYFVINLNETLVNTVEETANSINKTQIQFVNSGKESKSEEDTQIVSDDEIEINLYEEIRSRAYDARLSIGLSGMIMYMTLVYFAVRYSIVYLKRYLTVIVLSLMAPPLGVAYALQKAISGKSSSLKKWWTEFVMTVIIQIVHALIYAVFISTALALSMESVAGMIVALIFMNFALKAEKLFRQIFKMGDGESLAGSMAEAGDAEKMQSNIKNLAHTAMAAKPIANAMMNTPMAKGIKSAGKLGLAGSVALAEKVKGKRENKKKENYPSASEDTKPSNTSANDSAKTSSTTSSNQAFTDVSDQTSDENSPTMKEEKENQALMAEGGASLRDKAANGVLVLQNPKSTPEERATAQKSIDNYVKYQKIMHTGEGKKQQSLDSLPSSKEILGAHFERAVNITNHYQISAVNPVNLGKLSGFATNLSHKYRTVFGTKHRDAKTGKMVYDGNGYFSQFNAENLLGLSKEDKQFLKKEAMKPFKGVLGAAGMFIGLGTMVAHPGLGMATFAVGASKYNQGFRLPTGKKKYKGKYAAARLPAATVQTAQQNILRQAHSVIAENQSILDSAMVRSVRENNPDLYDAIMQDLKEGGNYSGIKVSGRVKGKFGSAVSTGTKATTYVPKKLAKLGGLFDTGAFGASMDAIDRYSLERARKETADFEKKSAGILKIAYEEEMKSLAEEQKARLENDEELQAKMFLEEISNSSEKNEDRLTLYINNCKELGYTYDRQNGTLSKSKIEEDKFSGVVDTDKAKEIESTIDTVIQDMFRVAGKVEDSEADISRAMTAIESRLKAGADPTLHKKHGIEVLFKDRETAKNVVKDKIDMFNKQISANQFEATSSEQLTEAISQSKGFSEKEQKLIQQIVLESGINGADAVKIMDRVSTSIGMQNQGKKQPVRKNDRQTREERNKKIKAIDEFLKKAGTIDVPQTTAEDASTKAAQAVMATMPQEEVAKVKKKAAKKSRDKIKSVLQFMEETTDASLTDLIDGTDEKIKKAKQDGVMQTGDKKLEFTETEADALQLLFNKMKEEVVFNQFTKNVLDQKDSQKTLTAKSDFHKKKVEYLSVQRSNLLIAESEDKKRQISNRNSDFGVTESVVDDLLNGNTDSEKIVSNLGEKDLQKIINSNKDKVLETDEMKKKFENGYSALSTSDKKSIETKITDILSKSLEESGLYEVKKLEAARKSAEQASKKATLSGKVDIYSQLDKLL